MKIGVKKIGVKKSSAGRADLGSLKAVCDKKAQLNGVRCKGKERPTFNIFRSSGTAAQPSHGILV